MTEVVLMFFKTITHTCYPIHSVGFEQNKKMHEQYYTCHTEDPY